MKEIVDQILREEEEARKRLEKASLEAESIILTAKKKSQAFAESESVNLKELVRQKKAEAENKFILEKEKIIKETKENSMVLRKSKEKNIAAISHNIFSQIIDIKD